MQPANKTTIKLNDNSQDKIVGGQPVIIEQYPYQASVRHLDHHICGGVILDYNTIITAAHCIVG